MKEQGALRFATAYAVESYTPTAPGWPPVANRHCFVLSREVAEGYLSDVKQRLRKEQWADIYVTFVITDGERYFEPRAPFGTFTDVEPS